MRKVDAAHVFNEKYCEEQLNVSNPKGTFKFRPKLLSVGKKQRLKYQVYFIEDESVEDGKWSEIQRDFLAKNPSIVKSIYEINLIDLDKDGVYVSSAGSCSGDSGGPMFTQGNFITHVYIFVI